MRPEEITTLFRPLTWLNHVKENLNFPIFARITFGKKFTNWEKWLFKEILSSSYTLWVKLFFRQNSFQPEFMKTSVHMQR